MAWEGQLGAAGGAEGGILVVRQGSSGRHKDSEPHDGRTHGATGCGRVSAESS